MMIPRYDESAIEAIETFDIKLEQARAVIRVLASAHTDPSGPTQKTTAFGLQAASALIDEAQRIIEPVIRGRLAVLRQTLTEPW